MPQLVIIASPNGAGKTTFAKEYLSSFGASFEFVNADEISRALALEIGSQGSTDLRAAKAMLNRIDELVDAHVDIAIETTLATLTYARKIPIWRSRGYDVTLIYLRLSSIAESFERGRRRVAAGVTIFPQKLSNVAFIEALTILRRSTNRSWTVGKCVKVQEGKFASVDSSGPP